MLIAEANVRNRSHPGAKCDIGNDRFRRISPVAEHSGEGRLTEPKAGVRSRRRGLLFMPHTCRSQYSSDRLSRMETGHLSPASQTRA